VRSGSLRAKQESNAPRMSEVGWNALSQAMPRSVVSPRGLSRSFR